MKRISFCALLLAAPLVVFLPATRAQNAPAPFKPAPLLSPSQVTLRVLPNGVRGLVKAGSNSDLVNIQVWVRAGSRFEGERESGAAHLVEILALRGSKNYPSGARGDDDSGARGALRALGGDGGALTSRDSTFYSATVAAPYAPQAMKILADAVLRPDLSARAVEDAKSQASDDIARRAFDPVSSASDLAYAAAFSRHPYRRAAIGSDAAVANLSLTAVKNYFTKNYVGANISVVVAGQIAPATAHKLIAANFGAASAAKPVAPKFAPEAPLKRDTIARRRPVSREIIDLAWRSAPITNPDDVVALDALLALWREGLDANLRRILLRDGEGGPLTPLVESYDVDFLTQRDAGLFIISLVDPADREAAVGAVLAEIRRVREQGVSPAELERAKSQLRAQYIEQGETLSGQAGSLGFYEMIATHRFALEYLDRTAKLSAADLQRAARKYLSPETFVRAEILPLPRPRPNEGQSGPVITAQWNTQLDTAEAAR